MIEAIEPYPDYKDTGLPWASKIPTHWKVRRSKNLFRCIDVRSKTGTEEKLTVSAERGVIPRSSMKVTMFEAKSYIGHKLCWPDDLVINSLWAWGRGLGVARHHGLVSSAYGVYRLRPEFGAYAPFIHHLVRSKAYHWELRTRSKGVWISRLQLTDDAFLRAPLLVPSVEESKAITRFIRDIDRKINAFIRNRRRQIEVLNEQKQAIINQAVTRGLDSYSPLKPSGVDWLGDIPEHWELPKVRTLFGMCGSGTTPSGDRYYAGSVPWLMTGDLNDSTIAETSRHVTQKAPEDHSALKLYPAGALVIALYGATIGKTGITALECCTNQACSVLAKPKPGVDSAFVQRVFMTAKPYLLGLSYGGGQPNINSEIVRSLRIPLPPLNEQRTILAHISSACEPLDSAASRARSEIDLINEYRTRLIADVVTGKVDVRHFAPPPGSDELEEAVDEIEPQDDVAGGVDEEALAGEVEA